MPFESFEEFEVRKLALECLRRSLKNDGMAAEWPLEGLLRQIDLVVHGGVFGE